jgi:hypothetical protein
MNMLDTQMSQSPQAWIRPQLLELDVNAQTQSGPINYSTEYSFWFFHITNDSKGGS